MSTGKSGAPRYPQAWPLASVLLSSEALGYPWGRYLSGLPGFLPCFLLDTHLSKREPELLHPPHRVKSFRVWASVGTQESALPIFPASPEPPQDGDFCCRN